MSYLLPHLTSGWAVDQAILSEENRLVVLRFGHDYDPTCMQMDEVPGARPRAPARAARCVPTIPPPAPTLSLSASAPGSVLDRGACEELLGHLPGGHDGGARLQYDVRAVRSVYRHVLLPE